MKKGAADHGADSTPHFSGLPEIGVKRYYNYYNTHGADCKLAVGSKNFGLKIISLIVLLIAVGIRIQNNGQKGQQSREHEDGIETKVQQIKIEQGRTPNQTGHKSHASQNCEEQATTLLHLTIGIGQGFGRHLVAVGQHQNNGQCNQYNTNIAHANDERQIGQGNLHNDAGRNGCDGGPQSRTVGRPFPQESHTKDHNHTRINKAGVFLNVLEGLIETTQQGLSRNNGNNQSHKSSDTTHLHQLPF